MREVIEEFTTQGRSVGVFCDTGISGKHISTILKHTKRGRAASSEFAKLDSLVIDKIYNKREMGYFRVDENSMPIARSRDGSMVLQPLGPAADVINMDLRDFVERNTGRDNLNLISIVLALRITSGVNFSTMLAGDIDASGLNKALVRFMQIFPDQRPLPRFDVVKVAHHGSFDSHDGSRICNCAHDRGTHVAVVSSGADYDVLPDREVLRDFLNHGWIVVLTTKRLPVQRRQYVLDTAAEKAVVDYDIQCQDIEITWSDTLGVTWKPTTASLTLEEITNYRTASKPTAPTEKT